MTDDNGVPAVKYIGGWKEYFAGAVIVACFVCGASFVVWMGNRVSDKGIGNGVSILLFAGIAARFPTDLGLLITLTKKTPEKYLFVSIGYILFIIFELYTG